MSWEVRDIRLIVKTYPTPSTKYGNTVCTAGILEDTNEWIRLYPIRWVTFTKENLKKFVLFRAKIKKDTSDYQKRKESHKIQESSIKIIDDSLTNTTNKDIWEKRLEIVENVLSTSINELDEKKDADKTSLGVIKPNLESLKFVLRKPINEIEIAHQITTQYDLFGQKVKDLDDIERDFSYKFKCNDKDCKSHNIICEDWELLEAFRKWRGIYSDDKVFEEKLFQKFEIFTKNRDLHFILGTHWQFPVWIIIGLFYPPTKLKKEKSSNILLI